MTGVIPVIPLTGTNNLVLGRSSALLLRDGERQKPVSLRWRGGLDSGDFQVIWASAFPGADGVQSERRTAGGGGGSRKKNQVRFCRFEILCTAGLLKNSSLISVQRPAV